MLPQANCALPRGFRLAPYRIERELSHGGFSIVYLARDASGTEVAIKEYLPGSLALRAEGETRPRVPADKQAVFRYGLKCFFEEGRALARLSHPNVVRVLNFLRANDTVYLVMAFEHGRTLYDYARARNGRLDERFLRHTFVRLLNGLREVHARKLLHLDIKPSNIMLRPDGTPVLLDFGAARQTLSATQPMLKPMYTPGFASPEQFAELDTLGPWTDIYGIGASLYACIAGRPPPRADHRLEKDDYRPLVLDDAHARYTLQLRALVDWCLQLDPLARPQSVHALQKALRYEAGETGEAGEPGLAERLAAMMKATPGSGA